MTDREASALQSQLDAMRLARAEDHKTCARLTARVKELEQLVRDAHVLTGRYAGGDNGVAAWRRHAVLSCGATFPTVPIGTPRDPRSVEEIASDQHREVATRLAEGTRDEKAARCQSCRVPCAVTSQHGMCGMCESERRCKCPPVAPQYAPTGTRCWQCGGRM